MSRNRRDHGGFELKEQLAKSLRAAEYEVVDFGNCQRNADDDNAQLDQFCIKTTPPPLAAAYVRCVMATPFGVAAPAEASHVLWQR
jgi:ribose 5-phosphate isomerase RpiB